ncbi:long-chain-fatty-acid--CoA ligase [Salininema proteolyticum]|uniref:Long-chain fatty acid--CoA ligase n=1 Tax=Salininema proteolyticum TaxID=1607685 RepID=A0ABV8TU62_9ACTN
MLNLAMMLEDSARRLPDRDAVVSGSTRLSYAAVEAAASQVAHVLAERGIGRGDRVALSCPNVAYFPVVYFGILKSGAAVVPLNVLFKSREVAYHLADSGASAYFCFEGSEQLPMGAEGRAGFEETEECEHFFLITADPAAASPIKEAQTLGQAVADSPSRFAAASVEATDTAVVLYTSGTTGRPKGAELTHANMIMNAVTCHKLFGVAEHDVHLVALPLFHSFGQTVQMNAGFGCGATLVLLPRFDADEALALMERERVSFFAGVPTMYWGLLSAQTSGRDLAAVAENLRMAVSGGAALPVEIIRQVEEVFDVQIREGYGLSETSPVASFNHPGRKPGPGTVGEPVWGVEMKLVDDEWNEVPEGEAGEIAVRGHNVMKGYLGRPEATAEVLREGWFRTGDIGRRDEEGRYMIVDRAKDMIVRGGFNVYPRELEEVMMTHPAVSLVAVIGVPHQRHGEEVKAVVVRESGADLSEDALVDWCRETMAGYKYPRLVEFRDSLPMTATGKVLKRELR